MSAKTPDGTDETAEKPKRPTLRLKFPPKLPDPPAAEKPAPRPFMTPPPSRPFARPQTAAPPPAPVGEWKCKPCGAALNVPADLPDEESVRCPSCNARLGLASDFRMDPPNISRLWARSVAAAAKR